MSKEKNEFDVNRYDDLCEHQAILDRCLLYDFQVDACAQPGDAYIVAESYDADLFNFQFARTVREALALFDSTLPDLEHQVFSRDDLIAAYEYEEWAQRQKKAAGLCTEKPPRKLPNRIDDVFVQAIQQLTCVVFGDEYDLVNEPELDKATQRHGTPDQCFCVTNATVVLMHDEDFEGYAQGDVRTETKALVRVTLVPK